MTSEETKDNRLICDARRDAKRRLWEMEEKKRDNEKKNKYPNEQRLGEGGDGWGNYYGGTGFSTDSGWW